MKIALDAMGGDFAPRATVEGAVLAARELALEVVLVGDRAKLETELAEHDRTGLGLTVVHAAEVVTMTDSPLESVLAKPESSIHVSYELLRRGEVQAVVSAGNSGAMMTAAMVILGNLPGVDRPAIASLVPTADGLALLLDAGANTEVKAFNLVQFAVMGHLYARHVLKRKQPRVGLLSNGEEDSKGSELTRAAAAALGQMRPELDYVGYVEGRDINSGKVDVIVTDGFTGNVVLKTMEGFAEFALGNLREVLSGSWRGRIAYLLARKGLAAMRGRFDKSEYGGAPLLGVNGVAIIAHGSSNPRAIRNALRAAADEGLTQQVNPAIVEMLSRAPVALSLRPDGSKGLRGLLDRVRERLHRHPREADYGRKPQAHPPADATVKAEPAKPFGGAGKHEDDGPRPRQGEKPALEAANGSAPAQGRETAPADAGQPALGDHGHPTGGGRRS